MIHHLKRLTTMPWAAPLYTRMRYTYNMPAHGTPVPAEFWDGYALSATCMAARTFIMILRSTQR